ncbi:MAG TPA: hypothetical protein VHK06_07440 [Candidatus Limnocylindria bacterium]|nr:hypothetical protein [Candidatus Limnocylindria bacterium]
MGRRLLRVLVVLVVLGGALLAWEPSRVALQTAILIPSLFDAPIRPLQLLSDAPRRSSVPYRVAADGAEDLAELWLPGWASAERRAGAMLLVFGVNNLGRNHPSIERVADGLARTGVAVLVPDSRTLLEGRLEVGEIDGVVQAWELLAGRPEVDPDRVGIVGFSVGGSLSLLAAADPRIAERVAWVNAFGAYGDAERYLASVAAHEYQLDGEPVPWTPTPLAREVFLAFVLGTVPDEGDRARLARALSEPVLAGQRPDPDPDLRDSLVTDAARAVHDLLTARSEAEGRAAIAALPAETLTFIDAISPESRVAALRSPVWLMHERDDHHVPFVESRHLESALEPGGLLERHTEFRLFDHVQPDDLDPLAAAPELWKLLWHLHALLTETL